MILVSPLLKRAGYPVLQLSGYFRRRAIPGSCAVVNYHGVVPADYLNRDPFLDGNLITSEILRQQIQFLKLHYDVITPEEFRAWVESEATLPRRPVLITCDDGLVNTLTEMLPVLRKENVRCLFFVTGASSHDSPGMLWYEELFHILRAAEMRGMGIQAPGENCEAPLAPRTLQASWWKLVVKASRSKASTRSAWMNDLRNQFGSVEMSKHENRWRLLNPCEVRELIQAGMSIGAHTISHPVLTECDEDEAREEIRQSKIAVEKVAGQEVWAFAYPFGNPSTVGEREIRLAREAGFTCAFLNISGRADRPARFGLSRVHVTAGMNLAEFEAHLTGFHGRLQRVFRG